MVGENNDVSVLFGVSVRPLPSSCYSLLYMTLKNMTTAFDSSVVFPFVLPQTMLTNNYFSEIKERSTSPRINGAIVCYILDVFLF